MRHKDIRIRHIKDKKYKYLWAKMQRKDIIIQAWKNLRKKKKKRAEVKQIDKDLDNEVEKMQLTIRATVPEHPDEGYNPPKVRLTKIVHEHEKKRIAHLADIHEQWYFYIIVEVLKPIVMRRIHKNVIGCIPGRGSHSGKKKIEEWIESGFRHIYKADVRKFYDNTQIAVVIRKLRRDIADERFLYCIAKIYRYVSKGILIGLYISPWLANYVLTTVDEVIERTGQRFIRYVDDIVVVSSAKKNLKAVHETVSTALSHIRLKLKSTWQIFRFDYPTNKHRITKSGRKVEIRIGRPLDFMGFVFYRDKTVIRKRIMLKTTRTARRLKKAKDIGRRYYAKMVRGMVSRMGWFRYTKSYDCYLNHIKPFVNIGKLKKIVSKLDRKENQNNEKLERGTLVVAA